jgi:hypothetical protein
MDRDLQGLGVYFVDNPVIAHTNSIEMFGARQFGRAVRKGIALQALNTLEHPRDKGLGEWPEILLDRRPEADAIGVHFS